MKLSSFSLVIHSWDIWTQKLLAYIKSISNYNKNKRIAIQVINYEGLFLLRRKKNASFYSLF